MQIKDRKFLVIGGAGFIGSHLVDQLLSDGAKLVRIYDNFSRGSYANLESALNDPRTEIFSDGGDILHKDTLMAAMEDIDGVFHLAALWLLQCYEYPRSAFDVNVAGTMNVIEAVIASSVKRLVFSSSASVYGDSIIEPMPENHPFNCNEFYGASKVCCEMLLRASFNREQMKGNELSSFVGLRYMNVYGPRQEDKGVYVSVIARMMNALDRGEQPLIYGDGSQAYDFINVLDCARANILAMEANSSNQFYNIGTGIKTSILELVKFLSNIHTFKIEPLFAKEDRPLVKSRVGKIDKARSELNFNANIRLIEGLKDLAKWKKKGLNV